MSRPTLPPGRSRERSPFANVTAVLLRAVAVIGAFALALTAAVAGPSAAFAAANPNIIVDGVVLESSDGGPATIGDVLTVSGSWDASAANPKSGDSFTIGLPPELGFTQAVPFQLLGEGGVVWANCLTDPATEVATCELTPLVEEKPELVHGTFEFEVEAVLSTTSEDVQFDLNGTDVLVPLPGDGGIDDGIVIPEDWGKSGVLNGDKWSLTWTIDLPGAGLVGEDVVNVLEDLSDNHELCEPANLAVETVRGSDVVDVTEIGSTSNDVDAPYDFAISLTTPESGFDPNVTYRITYDTCTIDKQIDEQGTEYTNEATVDIWGESSGVIGVTQDWTPPGINKHGRVLGGGERDGTIQWTVTAAGDQLLGKDGFTFSDELAGSHELCTSSEGERIVQGLSIEERYGPSGALTRQIGSDQLASTLTSTTATSFVVDYSIVDGSDFEFRPSKYLYVIRYQTCASTDGLPEAGTVFENTAGVDGAIDTATATVSSRAEGKRGSIGSSSVEIDGVDYLPQTTLDWNITVPGERLADLDSSLTVTDTLADSHRVCGTGENLASRLDLSVQARDQVRNGGLASVDLTDSVDVSLDGDVITLTIATPTLKLPAGDSATGFSREYQYVIDYTTCTTSGGMDAPGTTYGNAVEVAGETYTQTVTQHNRGSGTGSGVSRGSISVAKNLADTPGAAFVPDGTEFTVHVKEIDPTGTLQIEYDLAVPLNGESVSGPNSRGTGWTVELSEPTFPSIPGVAFGTPSFGESDGVTVNPDGTATAALTPASNITVQLTNTAELGSLDVAKVVDGPAAELVDPDQEYSITAQVDVSALGDGFPAQDDRVFTVTTDAGHTLQDLPIGATVSFSEALPADDDILTWAPVVIDPERITVTPEHVSDPATITVTNSVDRTVGTFAIVKSVSGAQAENIAVPDTVTVTATWEQNGIPGERSLTVPTDGTPVPFGEELLIGTEVTLTETPLADGSSIAWGAPVWSGSGVQVAGDSAVVSIGRDAGAVVELDNHAATSTAGLSLVKGIAGEAATDVDPESTFPVTATWTDANDATQSKDLVINSREPTSLGEELPAGTIVTLTEGDRPAIDTVVWGSIVISGTGVEDRGDGSATVVVSDQHETSTLVTVVNEATWAPGTFALSKQVTGVQLEHPDVPDAVTVLATWMDGTESEQSKELTIPTDGTAVPFGEKLPHETEVTLVEAPQNDAASFTWDAPEWSGDAVAAHEDGTAVVTVAAATEAHVSLVNHASVSLASLEIVKELTGRGASSIADTTVFPVSVQWTDLLGVDHEREVQLTTAAPTVIEDLPLGVEVRLVEGDAELPDETRWTGAEWASADENIQVESADAEATVVLTGERGSAASLTLENEIGKFSPLALTNGGLATSGFDLGPWLFAGLLGIALLIFGGAARVWQSRLRRRDAETE